jgi:SNF2 family DNA or RNA helicase
MVNFLRPNALLQGNVKDFENDYIRVIDKGMASDAGLEDVRKSLSKQKELNGLLSPFIDRVDCSILKDELQPMTQVVLHVRQTRLQSNLYRAFTRYSKANPELKLNNVFNRYACLKPIHSHPAAVLFPSENSKNGRKGPKDDDEAVEKICWWRATLDKEGETRVKSVLNGHKIVLLLHILAHSVTCGDKVLIFANCLSTLNYIEYVLSLNWTEEVPSLAAEFSSVKLGGWQKAVDFLRIDGSSSEADRGGMIATFHKNARIKAFLISKAGGIGVNLVCIGKNAA